MHDHQQTPATQPSSSNASVGSETSAVSRQNPLVPSVVMAILFLIAGTAIIGTIFGKQVQVSIIPENRVLAPLPELTFQSIFSARYFAALDRYLGDRFTLRPLFVRLHQEFESKIFRGAPRGMVQGGVPHRSTAAPSDLPHGMLFHRFIIDRYTRTSHQHFPHEQWRKALWKLHELCRASGRILVLETYRNAPYIFSDLLPSVWRNRLSKLPPPLMELSKEAEQRGILVLDHTDRMRKLKQAGEELYTVLGENHPSPRFFFSVYRRHILALSEATGVRTAPATTFPYSKPQPIAQGGYLEQYALRPSVDFFPPWSEQRESPSPTTGGLERLFVYTAKNSPPATTHGDPALLPPLVVYSDSFFNAMMMSVGDLYLSHFKNVTLHYGNPGAEGLADARFVMISFSDQTTDGWQLVQAAASQLEATLNRAESRKPVVISGY